MDGVGSFLPVQPVGFFGSPRKGQRKNVPEAVRIPLNAGLDMHTGRDGEGVMIQTPVLLNDRPVRFTVAGWLSAVCLSLF